MNLAVVRYEAGNGPATDAMLTELARGLTRAGYKLAGAVQSNTPAVGRSRCEMTLEDLASGICVNVSEDRGRLARGCRLDASALEEIAGLALASLGPEINLVIINRFGKCEAEGRGLRPVIEAALLGEKPVLVGVNQAYWSAWQAFSGGCATLIPADHRIILSWCEMAVTRTEKASLAGRGEALGTQRLE